MSNHLENNQANDGALTKGLEDNASSGNSIMNFITKNKYIILVAAVIIIGIIIYFYYRKRSSKKAMIEGAVEDIVASNNKTSNPVEGKLKITKSRN